MNESVNPAFQRVGTAKPLTLHVVKSDCWLTPMAVHFVGDGVSKSAFKTGSKSIASP